MRIARGLPSRIVSASGAGTTLLARQAATIDALWGGRVTLGPAASSRDRMTIATGFAFRGAVVGWINNRPSCAGYGRVRWVPAPVL